MKIIIGADLVPTEINYDLFSKGDVEALLGDELIKLLNNSDYRIFNLETPLTDIEQPISKAGPHLITPTKTIKGIKQIGVDFVTLANNHILDQGEKGLISTMRILDENSISYSGVGSYNNTNNAYYFEKKGKKIGIYCCAEHEFSIVTKNTIGVYPFDSLETPDEILKMKCNCDYLIVLYHGGKEHYRYPSPNLQKVCHKIIDKGADLVVCQHSHCIGCEEKYGNGTIVYGQGNFLFNWKENEYWNESILIALEINLNNIDIKYIPLVRREQGVILADKNTKEKILNDFYRRSEEIKKQDFIEEKYKEYAKKVSDIFLLKILNINHKSLFFKVLNRLSNKKYKWYIINKRLKNKRNRLINQFECEANRELIITILKLNDKE